MVVERRLLQQLEHSCDEHAAHTTNLGILAEGAIALSVTLSGGALFAS